MDPVLAADLVAELGSPLYAYDLDEVEARAQSLFQALPAGARLLYSLKANPLPAIGEALRHSGCGAEVSSPGELAAAREAGFAADGMLYTGPGKTRDEIGGAVAAGVRWFSCESFDELAHLRTAARSAETPLSVLLRINPARAPVAKMAMTGVASQFGIEEDEVRRRAGELQDLGEHLRLAGIHVYLGSQVEEVKALAANLDGALATAEGLAADLGLAFRVIDVGGGFPWPYCQAEGGPDLAPLRRHLAGNGSRRHTGDAELWFESGRYLAASSGRLLTRVVTVKRSKGGRTFVVLDAGINHLGGMAALGRILRGRVSVTRVGASGPAAVEEVDLVGPLCSPLDTLAHRVRLPCPAPGDLLCFPNVGAYGLTASLVGFLSRRPPLEVAYRGDRPTSVYRLRSGHQRQREERPLEDG